MPPPFRILVLDDSIERLDRFRSVIHEWEEDIELIEWRSAVLFNQQVERYLDGSSLISLDHDLYADDNSDPGDGLDAARHLATLSAACPVIIHSSNVDRALHMLGVLQNDGWQAMRVGAVGPEWIEFDWAIEARRLIACSEA